MCQNQKLVKSFLIWKDWVSDKGNQKNFQSRGGDQKKWKWGNFLSVLAEIFKITKWRNISRFVDTLRGLINCVKISLPMHSLICQFLWWKKKRNTNTASGTFISPNYLRVIAFVLYIHSLRTNKTKITH